MSLSEQLALIHNNGTVFHVGDTNHNASIDVVSANSSVVSEVVTYHSLSDRFKSIDWILVFFLLFTGVLAVLAGAGINFWRKHRISTKQHRTPKSCIDIFRLIQHHDHHHDQKVLKEEGSFATADDREEVDGTKV